MIFQEAIADYQILKNQLQARRLTSEEFRAKVAQLQVQSEDGSIWMMRAEDGGWLWWNGSSWVYPPTAPLPGRTSTGEPPPETLAQLFGMLLRQMLKSFLKRLPIMLLVFILIWIVHTFLLVGPNGGFAAGSNWFLDMILTLRGKMISGTLFWMLMMMLLFSTLSRIIRGGPTKFFTELAQTPPWLSSAFSRAGPLLGPVLLGFGTVVVFISLFYSNRLVSILLALGIFLAVSGGAAGLLFLIARLSWSDYQRLFQKEKPKIPFNPHVAGVAFAGMMLGFLISAVLPFQPWTGMFVVVALGVISLVLILGRRPPSPTVSMWAFFVLYLSLLSLAPAYADDGGWKEAGSSFDKWINSEGALTAVLIGLIPGLSAAAGSLLGGLWGNLGSLLDTMGLVPPPPPPPPPQDPLPEEFELTGKDGITRVIKYSPEYGGWIDTFTGGLIDLDKFNEWQDQVVKDKAWSAQEHEKMIAGQTAFDDKLREIADKYQQEMIKTKQQSDQAKQELKNLWKTLQEGHIKEAEMYQNQANLMDRITKGLEWIKWGADKSIDVLEKITGPAGKTVRNTYTVLSGTAEGFGEGLAHGDIMEKTLKGTGKGLVDLGARQLVEQKLTKFLGNKGIPGFKDLKPGSDSMGFMQYGGKVDFGKVLVSKVRDAFTGGNNIDRFLSGHIQSQINHSLVNAGMRELRNQTLYQPLKWGKNFLKGAIGS